MNYRAAKKYFEKLSAPLRLCGFLLYLPLRRREHRDMFKIICAIYLLVRKCDQEWVTQQFKIGFVHISFSKIGIMGCIAIAEYNNI